MFHHGINDSRISMRDIARQLGVSHATVSLALSGHPRISNTMRAKVLKTAERMGYQPDPMLIALSNYRKEKSTQPCQATIAWINAWQDAEDLVRHGEFDRYRMGASEAAGKHGYRLEEFRIDWKITPRRLHQDLSKRGVRGILLPPRDLRLPQPDWEDFPWTKYSVVRYGRTLQEPRSHLVSSDHVANATMAFEEILKRGYRRIGFVTNGKDLRMSGHLFVGGFLTALRMVRESERLPVFTLDDYPEVKQKPALAEWLRQHKPDAIFTSVAEIPSMLESLGVKVPDDVALASTTVIDSTIDAGIDPNPEEIGRAGFLMLNSLLNERARGVPRISHQIQVEGSWVDGASLPDRRLGMDAMRSEKHAAQYMPLATAE